MTISVACPPATTAYPSWDIFSHVFRVKLSQRQHECSAVLRREYHHTAKHNWYSLQSHPEGFQLFLHMQEPL